MRRYLLSLAIAFILLAPGALVLAQTNDDSLSSNRPDIAPARPVVEVVYIWDFPTDEDGDGLYDAIQVVASANFTREGTYDVTFTIAPKDGSWYLAAAETATIEGEMPMTRLFESSFEGWKLNSRKISGELNAQVSIKESGSTKEPAQLVMSLGPYEARQFETVSAGAAVTGFGDPTPMDFDGNGKYEIIVVPVEIEARGAGLYQVMLTVRWTAGARTYTNWTQLTPGTNSVPIWVPGRNTMDSTLDITANLRKGVFWGQGESITYPVVNTRAFEWPNMRTLWTTTHAEEGVPKNSDGAFNFLQIAMVLNVTFPGEYSFLMVVHPTGALADGTDTSLDINRLLEAKEAAKLEWKWTYEPGLRWSVRWLDGRILNAWDHDGTYTVHVVATGPAAFLSKYFVFVTASFNADDFRVPEPPLEFGRDHGDEAIRSPETGLYDALEVTFDVHVNIPGTFTAIGILYYQNQEIAYARNVLPLGVGDKEMTLKFPGNAIYTAGVKGPLTVGVWVSGADYAWNDTTFEQSMAAKYVTGSYTFDQFAPPKFEVDERDPQPVEDLDFLLLKNGILAVRIVRDRPDVTFYLTEDDGKTALLRVVYSRLLAFSDDNEDGAPQAAEVVYTSALWAYDWDMTTVTLFEDPDAGRVASFEMTATVDLVEDDPQVADGTKALATVVDFAKLTLRFTLARGDMEREDGVGKYVIMGGTELKVDILIDVLTPVDGIDFLTIEQILKDDRGQFLPDPDEANGEAGANAATGEVRRFQDRAELKQNVEFASGKSAPGFYSWLRKAEVYKADGTEDVVDVQAAYILTEERMILYLSYPYETGIVYIYHDPSLGVFEDGLPFPLPIPEEWRAIFNPMLFGMSVIAAAAVVYGMRGRSRGKDEDADDWDDLPPQGEAAIPVNPVQEPPIAPERWVEHKD